MFTFGMQGEFNRAMFDQMPRRDQNEVLQQMYDKGYSAKELAKFFVLPVQTIYSRINAHRGRGPQLDPA